MTAQDLLRSQIEDSGKQLTAVLAGLTEGQADFKAVPSAMTPRELLIHLCEAYQAAITELAGGKHEWGSYAPPSTDWLPLVDTFQGLRSEAARAALSEDDHGLKTGSAYIVAHDYYHVGQLCQARIALDPNWDPYSIYG